MVGTGGAQSSRGRGRGRTEASSSQQVEEPIRQERQFGLHPLLTLQPQHRLHNLINGQPVPNLMLRHGFRTVHWNNRYEPYVRASGFLSLHQIGELEWDDALIRAFVERWRPETHTFHLPVGEMTISLEDVSILLGLPIHGAPVCGVTNLNWPELVTNSLGIVPEGRAMANKSALSLRWLRENFDNLEHDASEEVVQQYARAYLLSLLGTVLFVDLTGDSVPLIYLQFLSNPNETRSYAWGAAVLARVYRQLCHGCEKGSAQMGGCMLLIQLWIWERFPSFRPKNLQRKVLEGLTPETQPPRGFFWSGEHLWVQNKRSLQDYRGLIDALQDDDVLWMPYGPEILNEMPPVCRLHEEYWLSTAALMDFAIVESYHPDRVMRQFGRFQLIPPPNRSTDRALHSVDRQKHPKTDWRVHHKFFFEEWTLHRHATILREDRPYDPSSLEIYLDWYNASTIPTFRGVGGICSDGGPVRDRLHRPEISMKDLVNKVINFAKKAARKMRGKGDKKFATEAFKMSREVVATIDDVAHFDRELERLGDEGEAEEDEEEGEGAGDEEGEGAGDEEGEGEGDEGEEEIVEEAAADDEPDWHVPLAQTISQLTQQAGPSRPKRPRRAGAKYK